MLLKLICFKSWFVLTLIMFGFVFMCFLEKQDVHEFLLDNLNNGGILELMMRYLKVISQKFLVKWPPGLSEVVLSIYNSWRKHSSSLPNPLLRDSSNQHIKVTKHFSVLHFLFHCRYVSLCALKVPNQNPVISCRLSLALSGELLVLAVASSINCGIPTAAHITVCS